ncbi:hypothetical protein [Pedobacter frigoris]|uniref:hypothetical protein n=1 Tax=Pedobacter frigoris TaxID=2571272 RepID=UPI00292CBC13|nr:hypothetical protein [Pedobacter frigoris]
MSGWSLSNFGALIFQEIIAVSSQAAPAKLPVVANLTMPVPSSYYFLKAGCKVMFPYATFDFCCEHPSCLPAIRPVSSKVSVSEQALSGCPALRWA